MRKVNSLSTGKVWENTVISHIRRYLADLELMRTYAIPNVWECENSHKNWKYSAESHIIPRLWVFEEIKSYDETQTIHRVWLMQNFILWEYYGKD